MDYVLHGSGWDLSMTVPELRVVRLIVGPTSWWGWVFSGLSGPGAVWIVPIAARAGGKLSLLPDLPCWTIIVSAIPTALFSYTLPCFTALANGPALSSQVVRHMICPHLSLHPDTTAYWRAGRNLDKEQPFIKRSHLPMRWPGTDNSIQ